MYNPLLIYSNIQINNKSVPNTPLKEACSNSLLFSMDGFNLVDSDLDAFISKEIIPKINHSKFDVIFIKDNLSDNYLELYGVVLAYHIRLSEDLGDKQFVPIVILSDLDGYILNKLSAMAKILFTKNVFVAKNELATYLYFEKVFEQIKPIIDPLKDYLELITVEPPKDYLSHHSISNEWSIDRWAYTSKVQNSFACRNNKEKIENMLYFKYLLAKHRHQEEIHEVIKPTQKGNVLLIDVEWDKGWSDIFKQILCNDGLNFNTFEYDYKDKSNFNLIVQLKYKNLKDIIEKTDVVILDLRLLESDVENDDIENFSGIKILRNIHEINAGIQVVIFSATSKSVILDKLYQEKILGYIKKEHPEDIYIDTADNINKCIKLIDKGLERKYLKDVYSIKNKIIETLAIDTTDIEEQDLEIFNKFGLDKNKYSSKAINIYKEVITVFDILDSDNTSKYIYAMISIISAIESILAIFIDEENMCFWDAERYSCKYNALRCRIQKLFEEKFVSQQKFDMQQIINVRNDYLHSLKEINITADDIKKWFKKLESMIDVINKQEHRQNNTFNRLQNSFS